MRVHSSQRRNVNDVAATARAHQGNRFATTMEDAEKICLEHGAKILNRHFFNQPKDANAGVIDENVNAAKDSNSPFKQRLHLCIVADVSNDPSSRARLYSAKFLDGFVDFISAARTNADVDSFAHQCLGNAAANAFRATRNDCRFILKIHEKFSL